jgi:hypothetical protein
MNDEMRTEIDCVREGAKEFEVTAAMGFQLGCGSFLSVSQFHRLTAPMLPQHAVLITNHGGKARVSDEEVKHILVPGTFNDQVSNRDDSVISFDGEQREQIGQLVKASVDVADYNCPAHLFPSHAQDARATEF